MEAFTELINSYLHEPYASLLNGILLGRKLETTYSFYDNLKKVGLIHIVVLSGMNITLLSAIVLNTTVEFIGRKIATLLTIVIIICFIFFVGIEPPIVRAAIMGILSLIGLLYGRKTIALYTLCLSGIFMIIIWPEWLASISFQLSFAATLGIILFGSTPIDTQPLLNPLLSKEGNPRGGDEKNILISYFYDELRVSLSAQVFTVPLIFFYFRELSIIAPVANILVSWLIAPLMFIGIMMISVGMIWWQGGFVISWISYVILQYIVIIVEWLSKLPFASVTF